MFHYKLPRSPWFYWLIGAFILIEAFAGCSTPKKIEKRAHYLVAHGYNVTPEGSVDSLCAVRFPVRDSLIKGSDRVEWSIDTVLTASLGYNIDSGKWIIVKPKGAEPLINIGVDTSAPRTTVTFPCPEKTIILTRTIHSTDTIFKTNTAQLSVAQKALEQSRKDLGDTVRKYDAQVKQLQAQLAAAEKSRDSWRKWFFYALALIGLAVGWQLLKARLKLPF
jgi:hypothetical protein